MGRHAPPSFEPSTPHTLAAIDGVISRGRWQDWVDLRRAAIRDQALLESVQRVCPAALASTIRTRSAITSGCIMPKNTVPLPDWGLILSAAARLQRSLPDAVLIGGTVDNASSDASLDIVHRFPSVRLLAQSENLGFARGNNLAIEAAAAESEWIALLNPDAFVEPRWLEALLPRAHDYPAFDAFGSKLVDATEPAVLDGADDAVSLVPPKHKYRRTPVASAASWKTRLGQRLSPQRRWCINKPMLVFPLTPPVSGRSCPYPDRNRHARIGHNIHRRQACMRLADPGFEQPGGQAVAEQLFEAVQGVFRDTATLAARGFLPFRQAPLSHLRQHRVSRMAFFPRSGVVARRHDPLGFCTLH
jgi:hypothetical protein